MGLWRSNTPVLRLLQLLGARLTWWQLMAKLTRASELSPRRAGLAEQALPQADSSEKLETASERGKTDGFGLGFFFFFFAVLR